MSPLILSGRYQVRQALATGGMGQTFLAEDTHLPGNPVCVVKQLKPDTDDVNFLATAKRLFFSEAETLQKLGTHAQIPRLLAYFEENNEFYLVQEYIEGKPLSQEIVLGQRWSEPQAVQLLQDILGVLSFVHHQDVIHRDLKPDNIIRRQSDQKLVLIDFGAVKQVHSQIGTAAQPNNTVAIGTRGYMPSEQISGRPRISSDLYAVGKIAIQALTGLLPTQLREDADGELIWRDQASVSDGFATFLSKMVRDYHKQRYQSSDEALQALWQLADIATPSASATPAYTPTAIASPTVQPGFAAPPPSAPKPPVEPAPASSGMASNAPSNTAALEESATVMVSPARSLHHSPTHSSTHSNPQTAGPPANQKSHSRRNATNILVGVGVAALVIVGGAIAYYFWQSNNTPVIVGPPIGGSPGTDGGEQTGGQTPRPEDPPDVSDNPFATVAFPQESCGDASVSEPFYRIYLLNSRLADSVSSNYCKDAFVDSRTGRVKVASFDTEQQAEYFKEYMEENVGAVVIEVVGK
ncbi:MAG: serine/threonine-protein kinase [Cyanobacteria bacterium J06581_3]